MQQHCVALFVPPAQGNVDLPVVSTLSHAASDLQQVKTRLTTVSTLYYRGSESMLEPSTSASFQAGSTKATRGVKSRHFG